MVQYIRKKQKIIKFIFWGAVVLFVSFFVGKSPKENSNIVTLKKMTPRASADVPYSQSSYYSQGSYGGGGEDSSGDGSNSSGGGGGAGDDDGGGDGGGDGCD